MIDAVKRQAVPEKPKVALLTPFVDARRGEVAPLLASMLWIFLALTSYYIIKPLRSAVLQERIGVDNKWIALIATTVFVAVLAYLYGRIVPHVARAKLILSTFCIFIVCLVLFAIALPTGSSLIGYAFFVWVSTFNLMIVSQFWSLAADVWTKEEGIRLFGFVGVGGVAGGIFGTLVVAGFAKTLSTRQMLVLSAAVLLVCMLLALYILRFGAARSEMNQGSESVPKTIEPAPVNSIMLVLGSPYLRLIAAMMLILNLVNTNNEWILDKVVSRAHMEHAALKQFYAQFYLLQNVLTFGIQFFLTARIQRRFGARVALYFEPIIGIVGGVAFMVAPLLAVIRWHKVLENACDYSIQSNTKELLYLPVSKIEKYSAKNFNDTFVVRGGDALGAATIFLATTFLLPALGDFGLNAMIGIDVLLGIAWLVIASAIGRMHHEQMKLLAGK